MPPTAPAVGAGSARDSSASAGTVGGTAPCTIRYVLAILAPSWGWDPPEIPARPVNPSNLIRIMPAKG